MPHHIAFISGPLNTGPNETYFHTHYAPIIERAISRGDDFVIGPLPYGVDSDALVSPSRITIFVTPAEDGIWRSRFHAAGVNIRVVGGQTTGERDAAMTAASTYDILRVRTIKEERAFYGGSWREGYVTNTERNWKRRRGISETDRVGAEEINQSVRMVHAS
ncbi:hypothetical protein BO71DRAFT_422059 [Aspergillus ellipticus CBS 707.79]|uniref:Uncharacterized protein n=1 Tax=Aspergillus ellipticus CBS 707.79 TaxID=1448320 RepID=A0A319DRJ8_9EURO|nr:hypothetical protein BO71DRAFT_422059 [Aspergillus ellipticus CBS 707.79]